MSDDWQPGDLALCVNVADIPHPDGSGGFGVAGRKLVKGRVYLVERIGLNPRAGILTLWFNCGSHGGALRFRKIRPHTPDAEDAETIRLLTGTPAKEPV